MSKEPVVCPWCEGDCMIPASDVFPISSARILEMVKRMQKQELGYQRVLEHLEELIELRKENS